MYRAERFLTLDAAIVIERREKSKEGVAFYKQDFQMRRQIKQHNR